MKDTVNLSIEIKCHDCGKTITLKHAFNCAGCFENFCDDCVYKVGMCLCKKCDKDGILYGQTIPSETWK